jgi:MazG family protein
MNKDLEELINVVERLRDPVSGCPWDLEQTHESLLPYLTEETYEYRQAVLNKNPGEMKDELGDVLLQVLLHSQIASEQGTFDLGSVAKNLSEKLIRRHPHVFNNPEGRAFSAQEISDNWKKIKAQERETSSSISKKDTTESAIDDRVLNAPALSASAKIGKKTEKLNFDWEDASQVAWKVEEEWQELKEELMPSQVNKERVAEELGDFLFSSAQLARHLGLDPEEVLHGANRKFLNRFHKMEDIMKTSQAKFSDLNQEELDHYWRQAKMSEKR